MTNTVLKLKKGINPETLIKYGFKKKFDEDSGEVTDYYYQYSIDGKQKHFTFWLKSYKPYFFKTTAWMSGFDWDNLTSAEIMKLLFNLIKDDIIEVYEDKK